MRYIWVFGSMSSGYADEHSKMACAVHSLSTTLQVPHTMVWGYTSVGGKKARWASFFAAPKKEGKKRAFLSGVYWCTAFGRGSVNHLCNAPYLHFV